jgi:dTDP-glucose 4,6-dehydratase/UDP-glucose 4-epimerase
LNIIIIGSAGFIGSKLLDRLSTKYNCFGADIVKREGVDNYYLLDIRNIDFAHLFKNNNFDICINASGVASVSASFTDPVNDLQLNTVNVEKLLECIRLYRPKCRFITLSSAAIYGNPEKIPVNEDELPRPVSPYGLHKFLSEEICRSYTMLFSITTTVLRIFSAYGEGLKRQILWDMANKFLSHKEVILSGTGGETRDFIHVNDIINSIDLIIKNSNSGFDIFNIANGEQISVNYIAASFKKALGSEKPIIYTNENRPGDPLYWQADISKIKALGYKKTITIEEGINLYIAWIKDIL